MRITNQSIFQANARLTERIKAIEYLRGGVAGCLTQCGFFSRNNQPSELPPELVDLTAKFLTAQDKNHAAHICRSVHTQAKATEENYVSSATFSRNAHRYMIPIGLF